MELSIEGAPTDDQKERLEEFLAELMLISRKYQLLLKGNGEMVEFFDLVRQSTIGFGLEWFTAVGDDLKVTGYIPADSILDGVWPVDGPDGMAEQRHLWRVNPRREA